MKQWTTRMIAASSGVLLTVSLLAPGGGAQTGAPPPGSPQGAQPTAEGAAAAPAFRPEELEQIAAPIALYPDPLLAQIFMAATYPVEIVQAARFAQANPNLKGDQLNEELKKYEWDDSVKSLVSFPDVLTMMDQKLDWTQKLGDAVLGQQTELMDAIQRLRAKAQASGNLKTTEQQKVAVEPAPPPAAAPAPGTPPPSSAPPPQIITIQPANPQVIYVPTYEPTAVYGGWPYPAYPPYAYYPPGYVAGTAMLSFGVGMAVGAAVWGGCNWGHGDIDVDVDRQSNFNRNVNRTSNVNTQRSQQRANAQGGGKQSWQHDPGHRKGAQYRDTATQQRYNKQGAPNAASREAYRGRAEQGRQELARSGGAGAGTASGANRGTTRESGQVGGGGARGGAESASIGSGNRAGGGEARAAGGAGGGGQREARSAGTEARSAGTGGAGGQRSGGAAFEGTGQGRSAQNFSQRGGSSMSSARASGYHGGGGGGGARAGGGGGRGGGGGGRR